ncbi:hypothetical protein B0H15DRAFT_796044 [Mycena belliarum]|uniref:Uncharacterized protein n=1 Tax=Mycena belliarum TaxID=1033014 RepID=A0AAD6ULB2_9AGAR|nr:hypothetical protein B0H15DRAFT_796044 [Mycena belliae]
MRTNVRPIHGILAGYQPNIAAKYCLTKIWMKLETCVCGGHWCAALVVLVRCAVTRRVLTCHIWLQLDHDGKHNVAKTWLTSLLIYATLSSAAPLRQAAPHTIPSCTHLTVTIFNGRISRTVLTATQLVKVAVHAISAGALSAPTHPCAEHHQHKCKHATGACKAQEAGLRGKMLNVLQSFCSSLARLISSHTNLKACGTGNADTYTTHATSDLETPPQPLFNFSTCAVHAVCPCTQLTAPILYRLPARATAAHLQ